MKNVQTKIQGNKLLISIDLSKDQGPSGSGKTIIIGTTSGNKTIESEKHGDVVLGVNCYKYPE